jgi:hypothetical protein
MKKAETTFNDDKDTINLDNPILQKIYELFLYIQQLSVVLLSIILRIPDVRSHIRFIRDSGVPIADHWQKSEFSKYKVYFIHKDK